MEERRRSIEILADGRSTTRLEIDTPEPLWHRLVVLVLSLRQCPRRARQ